MERPNFLLAISKAKIRIFRTWRGFAVSSNASLPIQNSPNHSATASPLPFFRKQRQGKSAIDKAEFPALFFGKVSHRKETSGLAISQRQEGICALFAKQTVNGPGGLGFRIFLLIPCLRWATPPSSKKLPAFFRLQQRKISQPQGGEFLILNFSFHGFSRFLEVFGGFQSQKAKILPNFPRIFSSFFLILGLDSLRRGG